MIENQDLTIESLDDQVRITFGDGVRGQFFSEWIYENAFNEEIRDGSTGQRTIPFSDLPERPQIKSCQHDGERIYITWDQNEFVSELPIGLLHQVALEIQRYETSPLNALQPGALSLWSPEEIAKRPIFDYREIHSASTRRSCAREFLAYGFVRLNQVPVETNQVLEIAKVFGYVRATNFGELFDVKAIPNPEHLAYSGRGLALHTDNGYRYATPSVQLLHCLKAGTDGGSSTVLDGFRAAEDLRLKDPTAFATLSQTMVGFRYRDRRDELFASKPCIELDPTGRLKAVYINDRTRTPLIANVEIAKEWYQAYRQLDRLMQDPKMTFEYQMQPGDAVIFHNTRVLHGRKPYQVTSERHLQGCYSDVDAYESIARM